MWKRVLDCLRRLMDWLWTPPSPKAAPPVFPLFCKTLNGEEVQRVGIAIRSNRDDPAQRHVGILFRRDPGVRFIHLAFHDDLRCESLGRGYHWCESDLDEYNGMMLSEFAAVVAERRAGRSINYGFDYQGGGPSPFQLDATLRTSRHGMTCSTFVLALFGTLGLLDVDFETWPRRAEDREWALRVLVNHLADLYPHVGEVDRVRKLLTSYIRVRPEETAIVCTATERERTCQYSDVQMHSERLVGELIDSARAPS